ncbi:fip1 motif family protein [Musa troglodytarum]|uniref:Fip1 motif family protein n=1 Tax=Musa troglodytarum TaxID=320322 RepID=A0A9E7EB62_9LILI|nr:fip1 motif family protein [Musa troglodytarum]
MQPSNDGMRRRLGMLTKRQILLEQFLGAGGRTGYTNHQSSHKYMRPGTSLLLVDPVSVMVSSVDVVEPPLAFGSIAGRGRGDWKPASVGAIPNASKHIHHRSPQGSLPGRRRTVHLNRFDNQQQKKMFDVIEVSQNSKILPYVEEETTRHLSTEGKYDEASGMVAR